MLSLIIAIIPSKQVGQKAILASAAQKSKGSDFVLDGKNIFPHITLFAATIPAKNLQKFKSAVAKAIGRTPGLQLRAKKFSSKDGYFDVEYVLNKKLANLHMKIITVANPVRENFIRGDFLKEMNSFSKTQQQNIRKFGHPFAHKNYRPHLTFTKFADSKIKPSRANLNLKDFNFFAEQVGIFAAAKHGTAVKKLDAYKFKK